MDWPTGTVLLDADFGTAVVNATDVSTAEVHRALADQHSGILKSLESWVQATQPSLNAWDMNDSGGYSGTGIASRNGGLFARDKYITPNQFFQQVRLAQIAVESDDIVSGVVEATEALAFSQMSFFAADPDEEDVYNQIAANIDLDSRMREIWRELFTVSQCYIAAWWGPKSFKVRGTTKSGNQRRRTIDCRSPLGLTILDPLKIIPVGNTLFGQERLAYIGTPMDSARFGPILDPERHDQTDEVVQRLMVGRYTPDREEAKELGDLGVNTKDLWLLDEKNVFRHSLTRPDYKRVSPVRLRTIFELLDMKHQLRQMERAHLVGGPLRTDQRVPTPEGWKPIGAIETGDLVYSVDGQTTRIVGVYPQGVLPMFKVTFTDGAEVYCDESHPWTVHDRFGKQRTITLRQIMAEGIHTPNGASSVHAHRIAVAEPLDLPEVDLPLDPYLLGYLIGNGSLSQSIPKITSALGDEVEWQRVLPAGVTVTQYEKRPGMCPQYGLKGSRWHHNEVADALRALGLWGHVHTDKFIPELYLWASISQRWALLQGLCDSDGHSHVAGGVEYSTVSDKLAEHVVQLAQSLGCTAKISVRSGRGNERPLHRVWISVRQDGMPFRLERKRASWQPRRHPIVRAIVSIGRSVDAEAVCIKTDREDGLFLTEGMVVTHNTNFIVVITQGTDAHPARQDEINVLKSEVRTVSRTPILVGDHRLHVDIVTPKLDSVLKAERWNTIDSRLTGRLYQMFVLGNYCLSSDTEILTADGWKRHDGLEEGDTVLTLNTRTGSSEWEACTAVNRFTYDQDITSIEGRSLSVLATRDHRWWVRRKLGNGKPGHVWEFRSTAQLNDWCSIPLCAPHADFPVVPKYNDSLVELVAWYWTEGSDKRECAGITIGQSETVNPQHCARIRAALEAELGDTGWSTWVRNGQRHFYVQAQFGRVLRALAPDKVPSPEFLRGLTQAQIELFINRSVDADGHIDALGKRMIAQKDERRIRSFEMACALAGIATSTHWDGRLFRLTLRSTEVASPHRSSRNAGARSTVTEVPYTGIVWCPTTPNGTWLARRNGTVFWTGNSAGASGDDSVKLVKVIARGMESRRHMIRRTLERHVFKPLFEGNDEFSTPPKLQFHPRSIALDFDAAYASFLFELRQANDLSRETMLNQFDLDQDLEAANRKREREDYDDIFMTQVPFSTPNPALPPGQPPGPNQPAPNPNQPAQPAQPKALPRDNGGGRRNGGGAAPGSGQGQPPRRATRPSTARKQGDADAED